MAEVDIRSLVDKLNGFCTKQLQGAASLCVGRTHYEVLIEHHFLKILEEPQSDLSLIVKRSGLEPGQLSKALSEVLEEIKTGNTANPVFSPRLVDLFQEAWMVTSINLSEIRIRSGALFMAFLAKPAFFASGNYWESLSEINREGVLKNYRTFVKGSLEAAVAPSTSTTAPEAKTPAQDSHIAKYCYDFTARAAAGDIDPIFGRDNEIREIIDILARRRKNNPILVGEPGVGKTAVIEGLALRVIQGDVPDMLKNVTILGLDMGSLQAGAGIRGEFESRLKGVINEIKASPKSTILFIDEAHTIIGAGGQPGGSDASNLLKPALARGELRTCAATTWSEYKKYFEKDAALARRFQLVKLSEPDVAVTTMILRGLKDNYESAHGVIVRDDAVQAAAELADRYISGRFLPDKAIDLLDTSCARIKVNLTDKPASLEDRERTLQALEREKKALERDRLNGREIDEERYLEIVGRIELVTAEAEKIKVRWEKQKELARTVLDLRESLHGLIEEASGERDRLQKQMKEADRALEKAQGDAPLIRIEVTPDVVAHVVSGWTGIPVGKMLRDQAETVIQLEARLRERIKGQDPALAAMAEVIRAGKAGLKNPDTPVGVFLLVGPSGVGKTETGLGMADLLFGGERNVVTINMSEFQESYTTSRLIGSPPGYVGYGEGGVLTEAIRQSPYSVVLLDEVEKAHADVMNLFYQVFDKGVLADGEGKEINFRNTILIMTSNLATDIIQEMTAGPEKPSLDEIREAIRPTLSAHFKPALLARMNVVPYFSLSPEAMRDIVELKLKRLERTLAEQNRMTLTNSPEVIERIVARCNEVETGARNIDFILNGHVLPRLSRTILSHLAEGALPSRVHLDLDRDGAFRIEFSD